MKNSSHFCRARDNSFDILPFHNEFEIVENSREYINTIFKQLN